MMNQRTFSERADGARGLSRSLVRFCQRAFAVVIVVTGVVASVATSEAYYVPQLSESRAYPAFVLSGDADVAGLIIVQVSPEGFADANRGWISTALSVSVPCTVVDDNACVEMPEGTHVELVFTDVDASGAATGEPQFAILSAEFPSTILTNSAQPITDENPRGTYAFSARRRDGVDVDINVSGRVDVAYFIGESAEIPEGTSISIGFDDVAPDFIFPAVSDFFEDAGISDGDGGVIDAG